MDALVQLVNNIDEGNVLGAMLIAFIIVLFKVKSIAEFIDHRKQVKISKLIEALNNEKIQGLDRELLESELVKEQLKVTTGLDVEKEFREAIIKAHQATKGELRFRNFQKALLLLKYEDGLLKVNITKFDYFAFVFNAVSSLFLCIFGIGVLMYAVSTFSIAISVPMFGLGAFCFAFGLFTFIELLPIISAKRIEKALEKQNNTPN